MQRLSDRAKRTVIAAVAGSTALIAMGSAMAASIDISANNGGTTYYVDASGNTSAAGATADPGNQWNNINYESSVFNTNGMNSQSYGAGNTSFGTPGGDIAYPGTTNTTGYFYDSAGTQLASFTTTIVASFANSGGQAGGSGGTANDLALFGSSLGGSTSNALNGGTGYPVTVALNNIPAAYQASGYNIYVYYTSGATGHFGYVTDGPTTYYISNDTAASGSAAFPGYVPASSQTNSTYTSSDYAEFTNLSGSSANLTLEATLQGGGATSLGLSLAGIQIVQAVPEPASIGLFGAVGAATLLRRRRYRTKASSLLSRRARRQEMRSNAEG